MTEIKKRYSGVVVPMISPFGPNFQVDINSTQKIVHFLIDNGTIPFVLGSTGEGPSLSLDQKKDLVSATSKVASGKTDLYAGITANSLYAATEEARLFTDLGATVLVTTLPYYYPIDDQQMLRYFEQLANASPCPIFLYNMPGMVKKSIPLDVAEQLSYHPNIAGMKDSERDEKRLEASISLWKNRSDFSFLVGWAARSARGLQLGADGIVPSTGNLTPQWYARLYEAVLQDHFELADELQGLTDQISALYQKDRDLSHSIPALKVLMTQKGLCTSEVLPPMYRMTIEEESEFLKENRTAFSTLSDIK